MASNTVTLSGNVTVTQGQSVLRGDRLVVNLSTGEAHVQGGGKGGNGRVQGLFLPSSAPGLKKDEPAKGSQAREAAPTAPAAPGPHAPARKPLQPSGLY
jgi:lipopolysaccharide export system protein LptA